MMEFRAAHASAADHVAPHVREALEKQSCRGSDETDRVVAPEITFRRRLASGHHPRPRVFAPDIQPAQSRNVIIHDQHLTVIAIDRPPTVASFPWPDGVKLLE